MAFKILDVDDSGMLTSKEFVEGLFTLKTPDVRTLFLYLIGTLRESFDSQVHAVRTDIQCLSLSEEQMEKRLSSDELVMAGVSSQAVSSDKKLLPSKQDNGMPALFSDDSQRSMKPLRPRETPTKNPPKDVDYWSPSYMESKERTAEERIIRASQELPNVRGSTFNMTSTSTSVFGVHTDAKDVFKDDFDASVPTEAKPYMCSPADDKLQPPRALAELEGIEELLHRFRDMQSRLFNDLSQSISSRVMSSQGCAASSLDEALACINKAKVQQWSIASQRVPINDGHTKVRVEGMNGCQPSFFHNQTGSTLSNAVEAR